MHSGSVEPVGGGEMRFFINGLPTSSEEVAAIDPADVDKVEVIDHPSEARYLGAEHVINYVVTKYLWGGYTKAGADFGLPSWRCGALVNSGFTYKRMTYSVYVKGSYSQDFSSSLSIQNLNIDDENWTIRTKKDRPKGRTTQETGYFTALYQTGNLSFKNKISLVHFLTPWRTCDGRTIYSSPSEELEALAHYRSHSTTLNPQWSGNLFINLPHNTSLAVGCSTLFRINNSRQNQEELWNGDPIFMSDYRVKETGNLSRLDISFNKNFRDKHIFMIQGSGYYNRYDLNYKGTVGEGSRIEDLNASLKASYTFMWSNGRLMTSVYGNYIKSDVRGSKHGISKLTPGGNVTLNWNPGQNQQFQGTVLYSQSSYPLAQVDPARIQKNLLVWEEGNPNLDTPSTLQTHLSYNWWNKNIYLQIYYSNVIDYNFLYLFSNPNTEMPGLTISYKDGMNLYSNYLGTSVKWNVTKEISLLGGCNFMAFHKTHPLNYTKFRVTGYCMGQWNHKNYMVYIELDTPNQYEGFDRFGSRGALSYAVGASAVYGNWVLSASVTNPFNRKKNKEWWGQTPNHIYSYKNMTYSSLASTDVCLSATYTIRYGRKQQNQNIEGVANDQSLMK